MPKTKKKSRKAPTQENIIQAIANEMPHLHSGSSLLRSKSIRNIAGLSNISGDSLKRSLGRIKHTAVGEVLLPRREHEKFDLPEIGIVAVSISIVSLNEEHEKWSQSDNKKQHVDEPSQELVLHRILEATCKWIEKITFEDKIKKTPIIVLDGSIVHGSSSFDILITILYKSIRIFSRYVREVIQRTKHVSSTQTLQVSHRVGFPNF